LNRESFIGPDGYLNLSRALRNAMTVSQVPDQALERLEYLFDTKAAIGTLYSFVAKPRTPRLPVRFGSFKIDGST